MKVGVQAKKMSNLSAQQNDLSTPSTVLVTRPLPMTGRQTLILCPSILVTLATSLWPLKLAATSLSTVTILLLLLLIPFLHPSKPRMASEFPSRKFPRHLGTLRVADERG